jgi:hypothetical protein
MTQVISELTHVCSVSLSIWPSRANELHNGSMILMIDVFCPYFTLVGSRERFGMVKTEV